MGLTVALNDTLFAEGRLYWDDGVRIGMYGASCLHKILFCCEDGRTLQEVAQRGCGASPLGDIQSPNSDRQNRTQGYELGREETNYSSP